LPENATTADPSPFPETVSFDGMSRHHLGFDIGGTFTDAVLLDSSTGQRHVGKTLTTADDPGRGALAAVSVALDAAGIGLNDIAQVVHGTTIVTNAILQRRGARIALITTAGFRDVVHIGRELRYDIYALGAPFPTPLVERKHSYEVPERTLADGSIRTELDRNAAKRVLEAIATEGLDAIAVCFLHSFVNPANERAMGELIAETLPEIPFTLSCEVVPEFREYERLSTAVANAYTQPLVHAYLGNLRRNLEAGGQQGDLYVMMSTGGVTTTETATQFPVRLLESGPAAGALAAAWLGMAIGETSVFSFDMGGTTAKACIVDNGAPTRTKYFETGRVERFIKGSGLPIRSPVIDMIEIGAGGGSIAHITNLGLMQVGPESAEADPGPACYGRGGTHPTVTDANLTLGFLNPTYFAGGSIPLSAEAAETAIREDVGNALSRSAVEAAWGIFGVVNENMASAARVHFSEKGRDPRQYTLIAFGGGGPIHGAAVARRLRISRIVVPSEAGVLSALGFLTAPISFDFIRTNIVRLDNAAWEGINTVYADLEARGRELLTEAGVPSDLQRLIRTADMRYAGQLFEITVPVPDGELTAARQEEIAAAFHTAYHQLYGRHFPDAPIQALNWRLLATGPNPEIALQHMPNRDGVEGATQAITNRRPVYFGESGWIETTVYARTALRWGDDGNGPAIIEERDSTTVVPPNARFEIDEFRNIRITLAL
jgi:N-methylhydantoinase A/oxoprolinase/acetone carboxylase beta subunit